MTPGSTDAEGRHRALDEAGEAQGDEGPEGGA